MRPLKKTRRRRIDHSRHLCRSPISSDVKTFFPVHVQRRRRTKPLNKHDSVKYNTQTPRPPLSLSVSRQRKDERRYREGSGGNRSVRIDSKTLPAREECGGRRMQECLWRQYSGNTGGVWSSLFSSASAPLLSRLFSSSSLTLLPYRSVRRDARNHYPVQQATKSQTKGLQGHEDKKARTRTDISAHTRLDRCGRRDTHA